jgi:hypothetical protein
MGEAADDTMDDAADDGRATATRRNAPRHRPAAAAAPKQHGVTETGSGVTRPAPSQRGPSKKRTGGVAETAPRNRRSGHPFVTWVPRDRAWRATVTHDSKPVRFGNFKPAKDTDKARADAAREAAIEVASFLRTVGRGREASVDADGHPRRPQKSASCSSEFVGVSADTRRGIKDGWKAQLYVDGKLVWTGYFTGPTGEVAAARAYDKQVRDRKLDKPTNFPE